MAKEPELPLWIVSRIKGSRADHVMSVRAKDPAAAIARVVKELGFTDPEYIRRLAARPG